MEGKNNTRLEMLAQDMGVPGVLEALAEYCDRSAALVAETSQGKEPAPLEVEFRKWSRKIWGILKDR